jgi:hypothetical protein
MQELDVNTLSATYACTILSMALIVIRLGLRYHRNEATGLDDVWMGISLVPLVFRLGTAHVVLAYGTNNFVRDDNPVSGMDPIEIERRIVGSRMILATRLFYAGL